MNPPAAMQALVLTEYMKFDCQNVPLPDAGEHDVLIEVKACGICGSDVHGMDGSTGRRRPPIIMGHEAAGIIARVGAGVKNFRPGDRVTFDSTIYCGQCWFCRHGQINLCDDRRVLGVSCEQYRRHGAFAQYVAVPQHVLYRLPNGLSFEKAAMAEALSVAVHAVDRCRVGPGESVLVVGAGMIGLLIVQVLRAMGCRQIVAVDVDARKLELASRLGAGATFQADRHDVPAEVARLTGSRGADCALEAVGLSQTVQTALASVRKGGRLALVGNVSPTIELPLQSAVTREITLLGSCASCGEYPRCLQMLAEGVIDVAPLISATPPLAQGHQWFERLYRKEDGLLKVILVP